MKVVMVNGMEEDRRVRRVALPVRPVDPRRVIGVGEVEDEDGDMAWVMQVVLLSRRIEC